MNRQKLGTLLYMAQLRYGSNYEEKVLTVMVNNSTNINKTTNHLSPQAF
jgi:hypothetical protein